MGTEEDRAYDARVDRLRRAEAQRWDEWGDCDPPDPRGKDSQYWIQEGDNMKTVNTITITDKWEPGDATRYDMSLTASRAGCQLTWHNARGGTAASFRWQWGDDSVTHLSEKMGLCEYDARMMVQWLQKVWAHELFIGFSVLPDLSSAAGDS